MAEDRFSYPFDAGWFAAWQVVFAVQHAAMLPLFAGLLILERTAPVPRPADRYVGGARRSGRPDGAGARRDHGRGLPAGHRPRGRGRRAVRRPDGAARARHGRRGRRGAARRAVRRCGSLAAARRSASTCSWCCSPPCSDRWSPGGSRSASGCWASRPWAWPSGEQAAEAVLVGAVVGLPGGRLARLDDPDGGRRGIDVPLVRHLRPRAAPRRSRGRGLRSTRAPSTRRAAPSHGWCWLRCSSPRRCAVLYWSLLRDLRPGGRDPAPQAGDQMCRHRQFPCGGRPLTVAWGRCSPTNAPDPPAPRRSCSSTPASPTAGCGTPSGRP